VVALTTATAAAAATGTTGSTGATGTTGTTGSTGTTGATGTPVANASLSSNWAGYAITGTGGVARHFTHVVGSWVQPAVTCTPGSRRFAAFWVGIGGLSRSSQALEQTGTEADCDASGGAHYSAWYELVPAGPVTVGLTVSPGDAIAASVSIAHHIVTMTLRDLTTGGSVTKRLPFAHPDTTSAEWIAEAPSDCNGNACHALPLSDFGSVTFTGAAARIHDGARGTIQSPLWSALPIELNERSTSSLQGQVLGPRELVTAIPTTLTGAGSSFGVSWAEQQPDSTGGAGRQFPGFGI